MEASPLLLSNGRFVTRTHTLIITLLASLVLILPGRVLAGEGDEPSVLLLVLPRTGEDEIERSIGERIESSGVRVRHVSSLASSMGDGFAERSFEWGLLEEEARGLELDMRFRDAAEVWRAYRDHLLADPIALLDTSLLAEAQLALAGSWVESGEFELARLEFRRALGLDIRFSAGPTYSPRVRAFFEQAGRGGPGLPPIPADAAVDILLEETGASAFLWLACAKEEGEWVLARRLRVAGEEGPTSEVRRLLSEEPSPHSAELLAEADRVALELGAASGGSRTWRRLWPWAAAGGLMLVAIGAGTAHALSPAMVEVVVRH